MDYLQYLDKNHHHPIEVINVRRKDRTQWQRDVMPFEKTETAKNWNWESTLGEIGKAYSLGKVLGQKPELVAIKKNDILIAMMLYVRSYSGLITTNEMQDTTMIWYVQKAPKEYLEMQGINEKEFDIRISKAILDVSLTSSLKDNGNVLLHADPKGGDKLLEFYKQEGFTQVSKERARIGTSRINDGRYFYMNSNKALSIVTNNREVIGQSLDNSNKDSNEKFLSEVKANNALTRSEAASSKDLTTGPKKSL